MDENSVSLCSDGTTQLSSDCCERVHQPSPLPSDSQVLNINCGGSQVGQLAPDSTRLAKILWNSWTKRRGKRYKLLRWLLQQGIRIQEILPSDVSTLEWNTPPGYTTICTSVHAVHRCLQHRAPGYLAEYCVPVSEIPGRQHLPSARRHQLLVPRIRRGTFGTRVFFSSRTDSLEFTARLSEGSSCRLRTI